MNRRNLTEREAQIIVLVSRYLQTMLDANLGLIALCREMDAYAHDSLFLRNVLAECQKMQEPMHGIESLVKREQQ